MRGADYVFAEAASLSFETSSRGIGIQIADVLASFIMCSVQEVALYYPSGSIRPSPQRHRNYRLAF